MRRDRSVGDVTGCRLDDDRDSIPGRNKKAKGKIVPVLSLTEHHAMKAYWGNKGIAPRMLDLGTRW
jgi:hypothetical protein